MIQDQVSTRDVSTEIVSNDDVNVFKVKISVPVIDENCNFIDVCKINVSYEVYKSDGESDWQGASETINVEKNKPQHTISPFYFTKVLTSKYTGFGSIRNVTLQSDGSVDPCQYR